MFGLFLCVYIGPEIAKGFILNSESLKVLYKPLVVFIWITGIPFFIALVFGWQICSGIPIDQVFTVENANRLKIISILSMIEGILYVVALCYLFIVGSYHTNVLIVLLLLLFFAVVSAIFTSLLSYLVRKASEIKENNDLTI
ncbi:DUF2975 domain-containing protein [Bacillus cereus]|uniref:DUF2975 domain-containing protein n=1 Tax=Bacillus cereus TaxID=1396 RepID=UPI002AC05476|nr:DUF2975 domain-containing protein [Bacillus cereus]MDZ4407630.1 DUF2975 domain-containing protein [Bacillus cereus]MDZ4534165.1 DUF2975 domain-containing protein [Bacillus cereus]